jgi:ribosomal RNA-processing protein 36
LATTGEFSAEQFSKSYSFLADKHKTELATLKETLKQARKLLASSPRDLRSEREDEVHRLEQAVKRAESLVNKDQLDQLQRDALGKAKKEEELKRREGKGKWFLKKGTYLYILQVIYLTLYCVADQQQLVMKARYEALAKEGGARAVKKAILKRQRKVSQSEKRSRPGPYKKPRGNKIE